MQLRGRLKESFSHSDHNRICAIKLVIHTKQDRTWPITSPKIVWLSCIVLTTNTTQRHVANQNGSFKPITVSYYVVQLDLKLHGAQTAAPQKKNPRMRSFRKMSSGNLNKKQTKEAVLIPKRKVISENLSFQVGALVENRTTVRSPFYRN